MCSFCKLHLLDCSCHEIVAELDFDSEELRAMQEERDRHDRIASMWERD